MANLDKDSFVFYRSFYEAIQDIPKKQRSVIYEAVFEYVFDAKEPTLNGVPSALWKLIRPQLDASQKRYENSKKGAEYGKMGGRPKKTKESEKPLKGSDEKPLKGNEQETLNVNVNDNENVNDNVNVNVNVNAPEPGEQRQEQLTQQLTAKLTKQKTNRPASVQEVKDRCKQLGYDTDAQRFWNYNEKRGWDRDWKDALDAWVGHDRKTVPMRKFNSFNDNIEKHGYTQEYFDNIAKMNADRLEKIAHDYMERSQQA